jgi:N-acetylglucosamine-6-sulfatase
VQYFCGMKKAVLAVFAVLLFIAPVNAQSRPNIVVIVLDDAADMNGLAWTKQNIADQGVTIDRFITTTPLCGPSRAAQLRGQYAHNTLIRTNADSARFYSYKFAAGHTSVHKDTIEADTVVTRLKGVGYRTGHFGKYLNGWGSANVTGPFPPNPPGWDVHVATVLNGPDGANGTTAWDYFRVIKNGALVQDFTVANGGSYEPYQVLRHALSFIRTTPTTQPLFTMVHARMPHVPSAPAPGDENAMVPPLTYPPSYGETANMIPHIRTWLEGVVGGPYSFTPAIDAIVRGWKEQRYRSMLYADFMIEAIYNEIAARGQLANTFFFVFSDNGWMQGEHGIGGGKGLAYRESLDNTPLWVKGPQVWPGRVEDRIASIVDLAPTWLRIGGLAPAPYMDGRTLHPLLYGNFAVTWRTALLAENWQTFFWTAILNNDWKLIVWQDDGYLELYDTASDPYERVNLAYDPAHAEQVGLMRQRLPALKACHGSAQCQAAEN